MVWNRTKLKPSSCFKCLQNRYKPLFLTLGLLTHVVSANSGALPLGNHAKSVVQLEKCFQFPHLLVRFYVTAL